MQKTKSNWIHAFLMLACIVLLFSFMAVAMEPAYAAEAGTSGTCSWRISDEGVLRIYPTDGVSGTMDSRTAGNGPWYSFKNQIKKVVVDPGVSAGARCYRLFYYLDKCTEMDLSGLDTSNVTNMSSMFDRCSGLTSLNVSGFNTSNVTTMYSMFNGCSGLTSLDVSGFDTSNVTNMSSMFLNCSRLTSLNVSGFNTSNVMYMGGMFYGCSRLTSLDVSGFDTSNVTSMNQMFEGCSKLSEIVLGDQFSFKGKNITSTNQMSVLPTPSGSGYTGKWIKEDETAGPLTAEEIRDQYGDNAGLWAGTWIWEETPTSYTLIFTAPAEVSGSMTKQKIVAAEDGTIKPNAFVLFNYHFDHWDASDGNTYEDQALIPANTYNAGDTITLTAVFEKNDNNVNMEDGTFDLILHGDEKATFDGIPAGTAYQVWEETPDGWVLLEQRDASGTIQPLQTADAYFLNKYQPGTTTATFVGSKIIDGRAAPAGAYTFELLEDGNVIQTKQNVEGGFIAFDTITYTAAGEHEYKVREVPGNDDAIDYDRHVETIHVTVTDDGEALHATVTYDDDGISFVNRTKPGTIEIIKEVEGQTDANKDSIFTFKVILQNENGTLVTGNNYYWYTEERAG